MSITALGDRIPRCGRDTFVHPAATVIGDVVLEDGVSVWPGAVLRGDMEGIVLGARSNVQDNTVSHTDKGYPLVIGPDCVIGHSVIAHGATVGARCLIGMGSTLLNGCVVGDTCVVGANALLTQGKVFPARSLIMGAPAKVVRELGDDELDAWVRGCATYTDLARLYTELGLAADLTAFRR